MNATTITSGKQCYFIIGRKIHRLKKFSILLVGRFIKKICNGCSVFIDGKFVSIKKRKKKEKHLLPILY